MRKFAAAFSTALLVATGASTVSAQQGPYMVVSQLPGDQPAPHTGEFKLTSFSHAAASPVSFSTGATPSVGKVAFSPVKISMRFHGTSHAMFNKMLTAGTRLPSIEIRLYNSTNRMYQKTVYEDVFITNVANEVSDEGVQNIEFVFVRVKWFASPDATGVPAPTQVASWDVALARP